MVDVLVMTVLGRALMTTHHHDLLPSADVPRTPSSTDTSFMSTVRAILS
jgi:hypothetical protein